MLIHIGNKDGYVTLKIADCAYAFVFGAFIEKYGTDEVRCVETEVYTVMRDIYDWYVDKVGEYGEDGVTFEFTQMQ